MTSIFIWKSAHPLPAVSSAGVRTISFYQGTDWWMEAQPTTQRSRSFRLTDVMEISPTVLHYDAQEMPREWVGQELLYKEDALPYCVWYHDAVKGTVDQIGEWMRWIVPSHEDRSPAEVWQYVPLQFSRDQKEGLQ